MGLRQAFRWGWLNRQSAKIARFDIQTRIFGHSVDVAWYFLFCLILITQTAPPSVVCRMAETFDWFLLLVP
jgi:hypothetical protein